jgi:hypothetical protein
MSVVVTEQLDLVVENQAIYSSKKINTRGKDYFFMHMQDMQNMYLVEILTCRICNNEYEYAEYGIEDVK